MSDRDLKDAYLFSVEHILSDAFKVAVEKSLVVGGIDNLSSFQLQDASSMNIQSQA
jgi:hypothetical protein